MIITPPQPKRYFIDVVTSSTPQTIDAVFGTIFHQTIVSDVYGLYDLATGSYTVPVTDIYQITGTLRVNDSIAAYRQFGVGVNVNNSDGGWFLWHAVQNTTTGANRTTYPYIRVGRFNAGDRLRMFAYSDSGAMQLASAAMQIIRQPS